MWAIVPLKSPESAKSRLRGVLDDELRRKLFFAMGAHVVRTLRATAGVDGVSVTTSSAEVAAMAAALGAHVDLQRDDGGTAQACLHALARLDPAIPSVLMISGDLPLLSSDALEPLIALAAVAPVIAAVADRHRRGTNALLCAPPHLIEPAFGVDSFRRHGELASARGVALRSVECAQIAFDIDTADDLDALRRQDACEGLSSELRALLDRVPELQS